MMLTSVLPYPRWWSIVKLSSEAMRVKSIGTVVFGGDRPKRMAFSGYQPARRCRNLVLDAGPLLSLSPLRGLADKYYTVPQVLAELKDKRAQDHFERLGLQAGVHIQVRSPDAASLAHGARILLSLFLVSSGFCLVIQFTKSTGDYPVLSHVDLSLIALTHALHEQAKAEEKRVSEMASSSHHSDNSLTLLTPKLSIDCCPRRGHHSFRSTCRRDCITGCCFAGCFAGRYTGVNRLSACFVRVRTYPGAK